MQKLLYRLGKAIKKAFKPTRIYIVNTGELVTHLHFHIIPIYKKTHINFGEMFFKKTILQLTKEEREKIVLRIKHYFF